MDEHTTDQAESAAQEPKTSSGEKSTLSSQDRLRKLARDGGEPEKKKDSDEQASHDRRQPGVPPDSNDDYDGYDRVDADSFPASDPPANY